MFGRETLVLVLVASCGTALACTPTPHPQRAVDAVQSPEIRVEIQRGTSLAYRVISKLSRRGAEPPTSTEEWTLFVDAASDGSLELVGVPGFLQYGHRFSKADALFPSGRLPFGRADDGVNVLGASVHVEERYEAASTRPGEVSLRFTRTSGGNGRFAIRSREVGEAIFDSRQAHYSHLAWTDSIDDGRIEESFSLSYDEALSTSRTAFRRERAGIVAAAARTYDDCIATSTSDQEIEASLASLGAVEEGSVLPTDLAFHLNGRPKEVWLAALRHSSSSVQNVFLRSPNAVGFTILRRLDADVVDLLRARWRSDASTAELVSGLRDARVAPDLEEMARGDGFVAESARMTLAELRRGAPHPHTNSSSVDDPDPLVRLGAACTLAERGDRRAAPLLVAYLSSEDFVERVEAFVALGWLAPLTLGFDPGGDERERAAAVGRWQEWLRRLDLRRDRSRDDD